MCRLLMLTANEHQIISPMIKSLSVMKEGFNGSGLGLLLKKIKFQDYNLGANEAIISGVADTRKTWKDFKKFMEKKDFDLKYVHEFSPLDSDKVPDRYRYILRVYKFPKNLNGDVGDNLMSIRFEAMRKIEGLTIFSFWPDTILVKEIGWPDDVARKLNLLNDDIRAKILMVQGRQSTNHDINLNACHPFFLQGFATMVNGENTNFSIIREFLKSLNYTGYTGYFSDSEVFNHLLHYIIKLLKLSPQIFKHIITPLDGAEINQHPQKAALQKLRQVFRKCVIDGPNAVVSLLPDNRCLLTMDPKKLRPAVVGGDIGKWVVSSEICGLQALFPNRNKSFDFQPMGEDLVVISNDGKKYEIWNQKDRMSEAGEETINLPY